MWALGVAAAIFVLIPIAFNPGAILINVSDAFFGVKFKLLAQLSAALLAAVAGASLIERRLPSVPVLLPSLVFLGISLLSAAFSGNFTNALIGESDSFDGAFSLAAGVLLFYAVARFADSLAKVRVFLISGVVSAALISIYGILQVFRLDPVFLLRLPWYDMQRAFSTLGWPLWLAAYLTLMMGAALALYFLSKAHWERWLWLAATALMAAAWLYTYSRGPVLAAAVTIPVILFLARRRLGSLRPLLLPVGVMLAAVILAQLASSQSTNVFSRFGDANLAPTLEKVPEGADLSVTTRLLMWRDTIPVIAERPLIGHGPDNFAGPFERHEGEDLRAFFPGGETIDKAHNELLQVAATTGLLGLAAYLWVFFSYFRHAYKSGGWPLLALSGGVLAYILQLQTAFTTIATGVTFWAILGVSVAVIRLQEREKYAEEAAASR